MLNNVIIIIALVGITYSTFFAVLMTLLIAFPPRYKGLAVPAALLVAAAVLYASKGFI